MREANVHPACANSGEGSLISPCLLPAEHTLDAEGRSNGNGGQGSSSQERALWKEQYQEHQKQSEDIEIETDALSLYEILRDT